ncbi:unnamed protein product [Lampetra fluviatilis]
MKNNEPTKAGTVLAVAHRVHVEDVRAQSCTADGAGRRAMPGPSCGMRQPLQGVLPCIRPCELRAQPLRLREATSLRNEHIHFFAYSWADECIQRTERDDIVPRNVAGTLQNPISL